VLKVKLLDPEAIIPTVGYPGEDLGYDLYTTTTTVIPAHGFVTLNTGIAVEFMFESEPDLKFGFIVKTRSSMGRKGLVILGGVIDAGYRGEIHLMIGSFADEDINITAGDKIANLVPIPVVAKKVDVTELTLSQRGENGFGSTDGNQR
jgi:dUTP pyrophosphatase